MALVPPPAAAAAAAAAAVGPAAAAREIGGSARRRAEARCCAAVRLGWFPRLRCKAKVSHVPVYSPNVLFHAIAVRPESGYGAGTLAMF